MKKTALITGASGGLGLSFARVFAREGYDLVMVARSEDKLNKIKEDLEKNFGISATVVPADLMLDSGAEDVYKRTLELGISVDVLVNNAGLGDFGDFASSDLQKQCDMIALNVTALIKLTHLYLQDMKALSSGKILNVDSIAAFQPGPLMSVYYATKAFVLSFSEALSVELRGSGVSVTALCPGPIDTDFESRAELGESGLFKNLKVWSPEVIAEFGYKQMCRGRVVTVKGGVNRLIAFSSRLAPRALVRNAVYHIQKVKKSK